MLLATDMDGTVLPETLDDAARDAIERFGALLARSPGVRLAYVTGRHLALARRGMETAGLPRPDWFACDVGTTVWRRDGDDWRPDERYRARMRAILGPDAAPRIDEAVLALDGLTRQDAEKQGEFKRSFDARADLPLDELRAAVEGALAGRGLDVRVVVSRDAASGAGLVDVLPAGVAKQTAVAHLRATLGLDDDAVVFAGDSGNDEHALLEGWRGIVVGNAPDELKRRLREASAGRDGEERLYFAQAEATAGVIEGARHFGVLA